MKKPAPKKKKITPSSKALKYSFKAIRKIIKKIEHSGKKSPIRPRISKGLPKEKLIMKKSFSQSFIHQEMVRVSGAQPLDRRLPEFYSENKLVLLVRDPWWLFGYWEVTPQREAEVMGDISRNGLYRDKTVLRVYDITEASNSVFFDIEINYLNSNWYIDVGAPDREWVAEIGIKTRDGRFFMLVRSNVVRTPPFGLSDILDEEWMMPEDLYFKLLSVVGGIDASGGSLQIRKLLEKYIRQSISSETAPKLSKTVITPPSL